MRKKINFKWVYLKCFVVLSSYDKLVKLLEPIFEERKIISLNRNLLTSVVDLMTRFTQIFGQLEFSDRSTLQIVVPFYYAVTNFVQSNGLERPEMKILKEQIQQALDSK